MFLIFLGQITVLCLGPLTNIALAASINSNFFKLVKEILVLGGSIKGKFHTFVLFHDTSEIQCINSLRDNKLILLVKKITKFECKIKD